LPEGLNFDQGVLSAQQLRWPAGWQVMLQRLARPWLALALLSCLCAVLWRQSAGPGSAALPLLPLLDWLGLALWLGGYWLAPGLEALLERQAQLGLGGPLSANSMRLLGNSLLSLLAAAALALALSGVLLAFNPGEELLRFFDAEHKAFSVSLAGAVLLTLLTGGTALLLISTALLLACRRLRNTLAVPLWLLASALLNFGLLGGKGWIETLGLRPSELLQSLFLPGLGGLLGRQLRDLLLAEERYHYLVELYQRGLLSLALVLLAALLCVFGAQIIRLWGNERCALRVQPPLAWVPVSAWSGALLASLYALGRAVWFGGHPGASGPADCAGIVSLGLLGSFVSAWLLLWAQPERPVLRGLALWGRLAALPLVWLGLCSASVQAGQSSRSEALWSCAAGLAVLLCGYALLSGVLALRGRLDREGRGFLADGLLLLSAALLFLPLGAGIFSLLLQGWLSAGLQGPGATGGGLAALAAVLAAGLLSLWLLQRPPRTAAKAGLSRADTGK